MLVAGALCDISASSNSHGLSRKLLQSSAAASSAAAGGGAAASAASAASGAASAASAAAAAAGIPSAVLAHDFAGAMTFLVH